MKPVAILIAATVTAGLAGPAAAHSPFPGIGEFYNGMLHPLLVPAHVLAIVGLGLLFGQHAPRSSRFAVPAFALALVAALAVSPLASGPLPDPILLGLVLAAGLLVALSVNIGAVLPSILGAAAGVLMGFDIGQNVLADRTGWPALAGAALGAVLAVALAGGLAAWLGRTWQGVAVRVLGSWTAASAFLVLALSLISTRADG